MSAITRKVPVSVEEYLVGELSSPVKHEYVAGSVYAMAGARNLHNLIVMNILLAAGGSLRGRKCRVYNSDTKVRIRSADYSIFYYPDGTIVCNPDDWNESFQDAPVVIFEVLSSKTRRIDEGEKKSSYLSLPSLAVYALVEQEMPAITVYRRGADSFNREVLEGLDAVLPLPEVGIDIALHDIYDAVTFSVEIDCGCYRNGDKQEDILVSRDVYTAHGQW